MEFVFLCLSVCLLGFCNILKFGQLVVWPDWAIYWTFQSLWQQLFYPNLPHSWAIFVNVSKSLIFLLKSFLGGVYRHLATFYWSHWQLACFSGSGRTHSDWLLKSFSANQTDLKANHKFIRQFLCATYSQRT